MQKKKQFTTLFTLIMMVLILGIGTFQLTKANEKSAAIGNVGIEGNTNYYTIRSNATPYQKEIYDDLIKAIQTKDETNSVGLIAENFIADFFTWTNKVRLNDVGGLQFIHEDAVNSVSHAAQDGLYNDMFTYLSEGKIENSLQVKDADYKVEKIVHLINKEKVDAYAVRITWEYEDSTVLNTAVYQNKATVILVEDEDGLFSIVEVKDHE